jgi:hypothetical protein
VNSGYNRDEHKRGVLLIEMRRGLRRWLILILAAASVAGSVSCGRENTERAREEELKQRLGQLRSIPYTSVTEDIASQDEMGVTLHSRERACPGYNLYCTMTGPEAYLMDMSGEIVHTWTYPEDNQGIWEHALLYENGDLMVVHRMRELLRLDWNSNLVWRRAIAAHHDVAIAADSTLHVIVFGIKRHRGFATRFGSIAHLAPAGKEIGRYSTHDRLGEIKGVLDTTAFLDTYLDSMIALGGLSDSSELELGTIEVYRPSKGQVLFDYFHLNTLTILPDTPLGRADERFGEGNILTCFRNVNQILVLDARTMEIRWAWGQGTLEWPHHPTMLDDGNILVFNNGCIREYTSVLEINPVTLEIEWEYGGAPEQRFYSPMKGSAQRLYNGNTLVCDGDNGRAFEVTRSHEIVWEWYNPETDKDGHRVQVYRMMRYPPDMVEPLLR